MQMTDRLQCKQIHYWARSSRSPGQTDGAAVSAGSALVVSCAYTRKEKWMLDIRRRRQQYWVTCLRLRSLTVRVHR